MTSSRPAAAGRHSHRRWAAAGSRHLVIVSQKHIEFWVPHQHTLATVATTAPTAPVSTTAAALVAFSPS